MKKVFKISLFAFASLFMFSACSSDDNKAVDNGTTTFAQLPVEARSFVSDYFGDYTTSNVSTVSQSEIGSAYIASFKEGVEIEFDKNGLWTDIEGNGKALPQSILDILPPTIVSYVLNNHPGTSIEEIERKSYGYKVELLNDVDLLFDKSGEYLSNQANATNSGSADQSQLPEAAKTLISKHFPTESFLYIAKVQEPYLNTTLYKAYLTNGYKLKFDVNGNWFDLEADDRVLPASLVEDVLPQSIKTDINSKYAGQGIEGIEKSATGYEIELLSGTELFYNLDGSYLGMEGDDDKNMSQIVDGSALPQAAKTFVETYFPNANGYRSIIKNSVPDDGVTYEVFLNNNVKMDLDAQGNWLEVEAKTGALPQALINTLPAGIVNYLNANQANVGVVEISKERDGYKLDLANDYELEFDLNGNLTEIDR